MGWRAKRGFAPRATALAALLAGGLCGCVENAAELTPVASQTEFVRRPDASMAGATVAIMSIEGAPDSVASSFQSELDRAATQRQIAVTPPTSAKYLARGYLNATLVQNGALVDVVWDVFTPDKQRAQRLTDSVAITGSGDDPWAMVSPEALAGIAGRSAEDLAAYLSNTPEAAPGAALSYAQ